MLERFIGFAMHHYWLSCTFLAALIWLIASEARRGAPKVSNLELTNLVNNSAAMVLDIRSHKDFSSGHIVNALNIPYEKISERIAELEKYRSQPIIVVDSMGQHAGAACSILKKAGFNTVKLSGGLSGWRGQSLPVVRA